MTDVIKSMVSANRNGRIVEILFETIEGKNTTVQFDVRYLWAVAADLRAASIDLLAPVPEKLRSATLMKAVEEAEDETPGKNESGKEDQSEKPKSGFVGLEQAWLLCDALNEAHISNPERSHEEILKEVAIPHFLLEAESVLIPLPDDAGAEVNLLNEFKIIYRSETNDWVPDRQDQELEQEIGVS